MPAPRPALVSAANGRRSTPLAAGAVAAASAQRFDFAAGCKDFEFPQDDLSFLGPVRHATVGNNRLAWRRVAAAAPESKDPTPLLLLMGYGGTQSAWGPTLLRRLAERRDVILFDNIAQVCTGGCARPAAGVRCADYAPGAPAPLP